MTITEAERYRKAVLESAPLWIHGESTISNVEELVIIADHYKVDVPRYIQHFIYSENPNHVVATGAWKNIFSFLTRLSNKIQAKENNTTRPKEC